MDFIERLTARVNEMEDLPIRLKKGYLGDNESFVVFPLPASRVTQEYYDGTKDMDLNFEFAMKSKDGEKLNSTLWTVQNEIEKIADLESHDGSFTFDKIEIANKPYMNQINEQGWIVFLLDITAKVTIYEN